MGNLVSEEVKEQLADSGFDCTGNSIRSTQITPQIKTTHTQTPPLLLISVTLVQQPVKTTPFANGFGTQPSNEYAPNCSPAMLQPIIKRCTPMLQGQIHVVNQAVSVFHSSAHTLPTRMAVHNLLTPQCLKLHTFLVHPLMTV